MEIITAVRERTYSLLSLGGLSGSGKTYSAILIARGLVGPEGNIGFIDTENKRARFYADVAGGFDVLDLSPPFAAKRYIEAIDRFEKAGYQCLVIDSMSHEWEGTGGCIEQAEQIEMKSGKPGLHCWKSPKLQHKKLINRLLQSRMHIIFCCRAKEKMEQVKNSKGRTEIISNGLVAIQEKGFIYEMTVSMMMDEAHPGHARLTKCPADLESAFQGGKMLSVETGEAIKKWCDDGAVVDEDLIALQTTARDMAELGTEKLGQFWKGLNKEQQTKLVPIKDSELKSIASEADRQASVVEAENDGDGEMKLGNGADTSPDASGASEYPDIPASLDRRQSNGDASTDTLIQYRELVLAAQSAKQVFKIDDQFANKINGLCSEDKARCAHILNSRIDELSHTAR